MQQKIKSVFSKLALSLLLPACVYAAPTGAPVASDGGLQVSSTKGPFWFNISGVAKLDSRSYFDDTDTTQSGLGQLGTYLDAVFIRDLGLAFEGGIGENYTYTIEFNFDAPARTATIDYAYLTYLGFGDLLPHLSFSLGQVVPGFCLNCASSSKWTPFMERSMATNTFGPQAGIGINGNTYNDHYSATVAITQQPRAGIPIVNVYGQPINTHDRWQGSARLTWAPWSQQGRTLQFGFSGHIQEYANTGLRFRANPEMQTPNTRTLLNTIQYNTSLVVPGFQVFNVPNQVWIAAKNQKTIDFELLGIYKQWSGEVEYQSAYVARGKVNGASQGRNLHFSGYHAQVAYLLTGEMRSLKKANGTLAQVKPHCKWGAWEIAARYSMITLNSHDINGGRAYNTTGAVSWYVNNNVKFMAEYVNSLQRRNFATYKDRRNVGGFGLRAQFVF